MRQVLLAGLFFLIPSFAMAIDATFNYTFNSGASSPAPGQEYGGWSVYLNPNQASELTGIDLRGQMSENTMVTGQCFIPPQNPTAITGVYSEDILLKFYAVPYQGGPQTLVHESVERITTHTTPAVIVDAAGFFESSVTRDIKRRARMDIPPAVATALSSLNQGLVIHVVRRGVTQQITNGTFECYSTVNSQAQGTLALRIY